jgi:hypothetical protein
MGLTWTQEAMRLTTEEFRAWKRDPDSSSVHSPAVATQLDRIEGMLRSLCDSLGIALIAEVTGGPDAVVYDLVPGGEGSPQDFSHPTMVLEGPDGKPHRVPVITSTGLGHVEAGSRITGHAIQGPVDKPDWAKLYSYADHEAPEEATE